jgi:hypothetical protein
MKFFPFEILNNFKRLLDLVVLSFDYLSQDYSAYQ